MKFKIRRVDDPAAVSDTLASAILKWDWYMDSKDHYWWVVFVGKFWMGYAAVSIFNKDTVYLGPSYIIKESRGLGLQRKLLYARERWARKNGFKRAITLILHDNVASLRNAIKCGYLPCAPWRGNNPENHYVHLEKML